LRTETEIRKSVTQLSTFNYMTESVVNSILSSQQLSLDSTCSFLLSVVCTVWNTFHNKPCQHFSVTNVDFSYLFFSVNIIYSYYHISVILNLKPH